MGRDRFRHKCKGGENCLAERKSVLGEFDECFSSAVRFTDVDGWAQRGNYFLYLEWKPASIKWEKESHANHAQYYAFLARTKTDSNSEVLCVAGDDKPSPPTVTHIGLFKNGTWSGWREENWEGVKRFCTNWEIRINSLPWNLKIA